MVTPEQPINPELTGTVLDEDMADLPLPIVEAVLKDEDGIESSDGLLPRGR